MPLGESINRCEKLPVKGKRTCHELQMLSWARCVDRYKEEEHALSFCLPSM